MSDEVVDHLEAPTTAEPEQPAGAQPEQPAGAQPEQPSGVLVIPDEGFEVDLRRIGDVRLTEFEHLLRAGLAKLQNTRGF